MTTLDTLKTSTLAFGRRLMGTAAAAALGLGLGLAVIAGAPAPVMAQDAAAETGKPALWVVRDADSTIYLFGTVHLLRPETVWNSPVVKSGAMSPPAASTP